MALGQASDQVMVNLLELSELCFAVQAMPSCLALSTVILVRCSHQV
jgi:hypothetical protein